jgi:hypothetical protein
MHSMKWGLVPHWSKAEPPTLNTINARAESLQEGGGMWGSVKGRKRCVVVAQGYVTYIPSPHFSAGELKHNPYICCPFAGGTRIGTTNGLRRARSAFHISRGIKINGSCCSPGCTTR